LNGKKNIAKSMQSISGNNAQKYSTLSQIIFDSQSIETEMLFNKQIVGNENSTVSQLIKERGYSAMTEARKEVISLLGGALAGVKNSQPVMVACPQEDMEEKPEDDVMNDADVAGLAMGWMSKGD
jgi:hypothetical protein